MRDQGRTDPKLMELYDEYKQELRQYWFSLDFKKAGGEKQWRVTAISEMCQTYLQMARHFVNVGSIHHLIGRLSHLEQKEASLTDSQKIKVGCLRSFLEYAWDTPCALGEVGLVIL